jgi:tRNA(Arg) A34 adenosine deaminase TadA
MMVFRYDLAWFLVVRRDISTCIASCHDETVAIMTKTSLDNSYMTLAMQAAQLAGERGDVPVGAVLVDSDTGDIISNHGNRVEADHDPTAHAEILVIREACAALETPRLGHCDLYVTLEPCGMCATAISLARIRRLYFAAYDPKGGGVEHGPRIFTQPTCHHAPQVYGGIGEQAASDLLKGFFAARR